MAGALFNGATDETSLPENWSRTDSIAWSVDLPGSAASTPIVWEDHVFLSGVDASRDQLQAICFDRRTGRRMWQHDVAEGIQKTIAAISFVSPATDGQVAVFFYGNGRLAAFDLEGKSLWKRDLHKDYGEFAFLWTFSSSPLLFDGKLYIQVLQRDEPVGGRGLAGGEIESYLLALAPQTGETLWRHVRPSEAVAESREAFTTPIPFGSPGNEQLLIAGGDALTGHDPKTGKEIWRWGTGIRNAFLTGGWSPRRWREKSRAAVCPQNDPIYALRSDGSGDCHAPWRGLVATSGGSADVPTPAFYDGDFFILSDVRRPLFRVEPRTGKVKWSIETPGRSKYEASPLAADGKLYLINFDGRAVLMPPTARSSSQIAMDEPDNGEKFRASIAAAHGQLFIRTTRKLYCVGQPRIMVPGVKSLRSRLLLSRRQADDVAINNSPDTHTRLAVIRNSRDPIRLAQDGEQDGAASDAPNAVTDPIRLVRMVKEIDPLPEVHPPTHQTVSRRS